MAVIAALCFGLAVGVEPAAASPTIRAADHDCSDFDSQADAQRYFVDRGGPDSDPDRLDADGDGKACDSLPCPYGTGRGPAPRPEPRRPDFAAQIVRVTDGDTIVVRSGSGGSTRFA